MTVSPRIIFAGTPTFALPSAQALHAAGYTPVAVYTQPDRPAGRGRQLQQSPIKQWAQSVGIPVEQPTSLRDPAAQARLAALQPDLLVVVAYGLILPQAVLDIPRRGCLNVHASLLPRWRGAAPIQRAILAGDTITGVSIMQLEAGLDTGPVLSTVTCPIVAGMTGGELHDQLATLGAEALCAVLPDALSGAITPIPQDHAHATVAPKLSKAEAEIDWTLPAAVLERHVLAFNPFPVAHTCCGQNALRIWRAQAVAGTDTAPPGTVVEESSHGIIVATGAGCLCITEIQRSGGQRQPVATFLHAQRLTGQRLGTWTL